MPTSFRAEIFGGWQPRYTVELRDGVLAYTVAEGQPHPEPLTLAPTPEQWRAFRKALDEAAVWQWRPDYRNLNATDGTIWTVQITYADRQLKSGGYNSFPASFARFRSAVRALIGGRRFQ